MVQIQVDLTEEQSDKLDYLKTVFKLTSKKNALLKLIDLTKIKSLEESKDEIMEAFRSD